MLNLESNKLEGSVPSQIGNLRNLRILRLRQNRLSGYIPVSFFNISSLERVDFTSNFLSGALPADMCNSLTHLEYFSIYSNQIDGLLPLSLDKCSKLQTLILEDNQFSGPVPSQIGNLSMLRTLYLGGNNFRDQIPGEIGKLPSLEYLTLDENGLTGEIPSFIYNISTLQWLYISQNNLTGSFPPDMCGKLPVLQGLYLGINQLSGSIPPEIGNCTALVALYLDSNKLTGEIPAEIGKLVNVEELVISPNNFRGQIPESIFNISTLRVIQLRASNLIGNLPPTMGERLPNLEAVFLGQNNLTGVIPDTISNSSKISHLSVVANKLTGPIPNSLGYLENLDFLSLGENNFISYSPELSFITSLTNCRRLRVMWIQNNSCDAYIPRSIGNLSTSLEQIDASNSEIKGSIPSEIGNLSNLASLYIDGNGLTGFIPTTIKGLGNLQVFSLINNRVTGVVPNDLCRLSKLGEITLSKNKLYGPLPPCLGNITSLRYLNLDSNELNTSLPASLGGLKDVLRINLSTNFFRGHLPSELGGLKVATSIDLSANELSGDIPSTFEGLQNLINFSLSQNTLEGPIPESFGNLISLEILDLSHNRLSGEIPKSLEELVHLKYFNLSFNGLTGEIPSGGPFANFTHQSFISNKALCGPPWLQVPPCHSSSTHRSGIKTLLIVVLLCGGLAVLASISAFVFIRRRNRNGTRAEMDVFSGITPGRIAYHELLRATNGFRKSNLLGMGSYGSVYKGTLTDGTILAIKVFNLQIEGAYKSFDTECEILRNLRHRNMTKVISSCSNPDFRALLLEYMSNGSLEKWLHSDDHSLGLLQRLNIMIDVATALEYLHHGYSVPVIHCDLKPSNVLLDEDMVAHVSDFGIAKLVGAEKSITQTKTLATLGYIAPEYGLEGLVSARCDVYSYGIMLMETFTGKKPSDDLFAGEFSLRGWINDSFPNSVVKVIDTRLLDTEEDCFTEQVQCVSTILKVALNCSAEQPGERINIKDALASLGNIKSQFTGKC
ncbi:hypothetical protein ACH5RR_018195 [Cinchona calisaya]|uniref:non-specific serine/threonine protein kinase n=1 Tax=Cinchona calisaya TaxID=153742 RepID=A0ABD2ZMF3_9GENT